MPDRHSGIIVYLESVPESAVARLQVIVNEHPDAEFIVAGGLGNDDACPLEAAQSLGGMPKPRPDSHVEDRLSPEDRVALDVWHLGRRARALATAADPDAPAAEAAFREAEASAIEAGILMQQVDGKDPRARYPVFA